MAQNTPINALPWPELGDIPNAQTAFQNLANQLDTRLVPRFANNAARAAAITAPTAGMLSYQLDSGRFEYFDGSTWNPLRADVRMKTKLDAPIASVTFSNIPSTCARVCITWTARADNAVTLQSLLVRVNGDSGAAYRWAAMQNNNGTFAGGVGNGVTSMTHGTMFGASASAGLFASGVITFEGWDSPHAGFLGCTAQAQALIDGSTYNVWSSSGHYSAGGPYTSVTLLPQAGDFVAGSEFVLVAQEF